MRFVYQLLSCLLFAGVLGAQTVLSPAFDWAETTTVLTVGDRTFERFAFSGAAYNERQPQLPYYVERFSVRGKGEPRVSVEDLVTEPFTPRRPEDLADLPTQLEFFTGVVREPEGFFGKVSFVPLLRTGSGFARVVRARLRVDFVPTAAGRGPEFTTVSVLREGDLYKIAVAEDGIHRLSYDFLKDKLGITDLDGIDPRNIRLYGNGAGYLPYPVDADRPDDLIEQAIFIEGEGDGRFDGGDYLLFYAQGPNPWSYDPVRDRFDRQMNIYDTRNHYFLKIGSGNGLRVAEVAGPATSTYTSTGFDDVQRFEEERRNVLNDIFSGIGSGPYWYGAFFRNDRDVEIRDFFNFPNPIGSEPLIVRAMMALRTSGTSSRYRVDVNGQSLQSELGNAVSIGSEITAAAVRRTPLDGEVPGLGTGAVDVEVVYPFPVGARESEAYLDWVQLRARRELRMTGDQMPFRDTRSRGETATRFELRGTTDQSWVWDITDPLRPRAVVGERGGDTYRFTASTATELREFIGFNSAANLLTPEAVGKVENQNLHGITEADMILVYHPDFAAAAERLAEHRREYSGLRVALVDVTELYNEFSGGSVDPTAIRDFALMIHERYPALRYLLLIGDASFDQRDILQQGSNFIPVLEYETQPSEVGSYPADDYYGIFVPPTSGDYLTPDLSISVGRLPVKTSGEADGVVEKIINYDISPEALSDWRVRSVYVGDDEDGNKHSRDVDEIARAADARMPEINQEKLIFDLFPQESQSGGDRYPEVTERLDRAMFRGNLLVTYLGHGGPRGWAQERVLTIPQILKWRNAKQLPVFITATCTFAGFDDPSFVSAGEQTLLNPRGGAVALMTTTRPVFANENKNLTLATTNRLLELDNGRRPTLGDVIRRAKNAQSNSAFSVANVRKYALLGDPATEFALPLKRVVTTRVNEQPVSATSGIVDTLRALQKVTIAGEIQNQDGSPAVGFNGLVYPSIFDKAVDLKTLQQDPTSVEQIVRVQRNVLFRGKATVTNGKFTFTFVVPKDINYDFGLGKISYYAADPATRIDAAGVFEGIVIGGTNEAGFADDQAPRVEVFMNTEDFVAGGVVDPDATLLVKLADENGINVAGNSIGHDLEAWLDGDTRKSFLLNDFYEAAADDFTQGQVRFPLFDLEPGVHQIRVRAWDVANNSGEGTTEFIVAADGATALERVLNYPNPFTDRTCFQFDHNLVGEDLDVIVEIYTISGRLVKSLRTFLPAADGALRQDDCIAWDGRDDYGDQLARGVYLYRVRVRSQSDGGRGAESEFEKLVILK